MNITFQNGTAVTPNDTNPLPGGPCEAVYVGLGGDVAVMHINAVAATTYKNVPTGAFLAVKAVKVMATNTTATNLVAVY